MVLIKLIQSEGSIWKGGIIVNNLEVNSTKLNNSAYITVILTLFLTNKRYTFENKM